MLFRRDGALFSPACPVHLSIAEGSFMIERLPFPGGEGSRNTEIGTVYIFDKKYRRCGVPGGIPPCFKGLPQSSIWKAGSIRLDRKSTRLNSSHVAISYAVFCLKKK